VCDSLRGNSAIGARRRAGDDARGEARCHSDGRRVIRKGHICLRIVIEEEES